MSEIFSLTKMIKLDVNGIIRTYNLVIPPNLNNPSGLIIALHGFSGNAKTIERISNLTDYAKRYNFFVAYPNGYGTKTNVLFSWNALFCCGGALQNNSEDLKFIKLLINSIKTKYKIDNSKIIIAGMSNGAMMANRIAIELNDLVTGLVSVAGAIGTTYPNNIRFQYSSKPMNVLVFHSLNDTFLPYNGGKGITSDPNHFLPVDEQVNYWKTVNQSDPVPKKELLSNGKVIKQLFFSEKTGKEVILYTLKEGAHTWPGGSKGIQTAGKPVSKDICDASQLMVDYFIK